MNILAISDLHEEFDYLHRLPEVVQEAGIEAVVFTGNILRAEARRAEWERAQAERRAPDLTRPEILRERDDDAQSLLRFFEFLNRLEVPVFIIPGENDAPERFFLQAAFNAEIVAPHVHMVHRSFAPLGRGYIVAGFGGEITENEREYECVLRYPAWEATFALDFLRHLEGEKLLLFHTPPAGVFEGEAEPGGHEAVSHLIKTYDPRFAFCSRQGGQKGRLLVGNTLVVCPGQLRQGDYAILDTRERRVAFGDLR